MKARWLVLAAVLTLIVSFGAIWAKGGFSGKPALPLSDVTGTSRSFLATAADAESAVTNAFAFFKYHDMMLTDPVGEDWMAADWHPTNGFLLVPTVSSLGVVPMKTILGRRSLEYIAAFHIVVKPLGKGETQVTVKTVTSKVIAGLAVSHGGITGNTIQIPPVRREEENILCAIAAELKRKRTL
jgi:hypothetical protein